MGNRNTKIKEIDIESQEEVKLQHKITYFFKKQEINLSCTENEFQSYKDACNRRIY